MNGARSTAELTGATPFLARTTDEPRRLARPGGLDQVALRARPPGIGGSVPGFALPMPNEIGSFIMKDVFLLGAALLSGAEAIAVARRGASS
jgi:hypothetical protein